MVKRGDISPIEYIQKCLLPEYTVELSKKIEQNKCINIGLPRTHTISDCKENWTKPSTIKINVSRPLVDNLT